jgi:hypothetical protein
VAGGLEQVGAVDPGGADLHQQVTWTDVGLGDLSHGEDLRPARSQDHDSVHP